MSIHQEIEIKATAHEIYRALTSSAEFSEATGAPAEIDAEEGGRFSCFGGQITGRQLELLPNRRIVQAWRAGSWTEGSYSIVRFTLDAGTDKTTVTLDQTGCPEGSESQLDAGWHKMYWEPLKAFCG